MDSSLFLVDNSEKSIASLVNNNIPIVLFDRYFRKSMSAMWR